MISGDNLEMTGILLMVRSGRFEKLNSESKEKKKIINHITD